MRRCARPGTREVFYQYTDAAPCKGVAAHDLHPMRTDFHLSEQTAARLTAQLDEREGFALDCGETVLFGVCRNCRK